MARNVHELMTICFPGEAPADGGATAAGGFASAPTPEDYMNYLEVAEAEEAKFQKSYARFATDWPTRSRRKPGCGSKVLRTLLDLLQSAAVR